MKKVMFSTILALCAFAQGAQASTVTISSQDTTVLPSAAFVTAPNSFTGPFVLSTTGSIANVQRSPWGDSDTTHPYSVLSAGGTAASSATYNLGSTGFSFLWGSPDSYNVVTFYSLANGGGSVLGTFTGTNLVPPASAGAGFDFISFNVDTGTIGSVVLADTGQAAFEYANVGTTPLPSTWLMLLSGFAGFGFLAYRGTRKSSAALAAA